MKKFVSFILMALFALVAFAGSGSIDLKAMFAPQEPARGMIIAMQPGSTAYGVQQVLDGAVGTLIFCKENYVVLAWPIKDQGMAWIVFDKATLQFVKSEALIYRIMDIKGNLTGMKDTKDFFNFLTQNGWKIITAEEFAKMIAAQTYSVINFTSNTLPTFFIMPAAIFDTSEFEMYKCPDCYVGPQ